MWALASVRALLPSWLAMDWRISVSRSASARAMSASRFFSAMFFTARVSSTPSLSEKFWMVMLTISRPMFFMSMVAALWVSWANLSRFCTRSAMVIRPMISRMLPSSTCMATAAISGCFQPRNCSAAVATDTSSLPILMLATPSTIMPMYSWVGTGCVVLMSTCMMPRFSLSTRSKKGMTKVAPPRTMR